MTIQIETHGDLTRTFSDAGYYIVQSETGAEYQEAWDPITHKRTYTESDHKIEEVEPADDRPDELTGALLEAAEIMLGGDRDE